MSEPVAPSVVRVLDARGDAVGAGFVVGPGRIATCAHVVTAAVGGDPYDPVAPTATLRLDRPLAANGDGRAGDGAAAVVPAVHEAVVASWRPIDPATGTGDVAVLQLVGPPPAAPVPALFRPDAPWGHRFRVVGFPPGMQDGVWVGGELRDHQGTRWLQLQPDAHGPPIAAGFSGAPVWDDDVGAVVGMTVASDVGPAGSSAYLVPIEDVIGTDPRLLPNPYRGLEPFGEEHADLFFGRDDEVARLEALLDREPVVAVVGRSGTGKSSLVRAGLLPRVRRAGPRVVEVRPGPGGELPTLDVLDAAGAGGPDGAGRPDPAVPVLLFVDQFEELVGATPPAGADPTASPARDLLRRILDHQRAAGRGPDGRPRLRVVLTLRWEAMNELLTEDVVATFEHGTLALAPMSRDQLRRAVVGPAARAPGLRFDDGLVERILDEAVDEPGQLPLVESLLHRLWASRRGGTLTAAAYEALGGVRGAVARQAEAAVADLESGGGDPGEAVRRLLTRLARPDDGAGFARRPGRLDLLPPDQARVADHLARARLLVVGQQADGTRTVELAHQALIDHWPRLRAWLDEDRDFLVWQQELGHQHAAWERSGRDDGALLRGQALARADDWLRRRGDDVAAPLVELVAASARRAGRDRRRRRGLRAGVGAAVVLVLLFGSLFAYQRRVTGREQARADSRAMAALSADTAASDPAWSILVALAAHARRPTPESENALFRHYVTYRSTETVLSSARGELQEVDASGDGRVVVGHTQGGSVTVWRREPGRPLVTEHLGVGQVFQVDLSDDGTQLLLAGQRGVWVQDVVSGATVFEIDVEARDVHMLVLAADGSALLRLVDDPANEPAVLERWTADGRSGRLRADRPITHEPVGAGPEEGTVLFWEELLNFEGPDRLLSWDPATGEVTTVVEVAGGGWRLAGDVLVGCSDDGDGLVRVDLPGGAPRTLPLPSGAFCSQTVVPVDDRAEVAAVDGASIDLRTGEVQAQAPSPFSPTTLSGPVVRDGDRRFTVEAEGATVVVEELLAGDETVPAERLARTGDPNGAQTRLPNVHHAELLRDGGHVLFVSGDDRELVVAPVGDGGEVGGPTATAERPSPAWPIDVGTVRSDPDGRLLADRVSTTVVQIRELPSLELRHELRFEPVGSADSGSAEMWWDRAGRLVTRTGALIKWWDPGSGEVVAELDVVDAGLVEEGRLDDFHLGTYLDPDRFTVGVTGDEELQVVDVGSGEVVGTVRVPDDAIAARFQPDSRYFAVLRRGSLVELWDRVEGRRVLGPLPSLAETSPQPGDFFAQFTDEEGGYVVGDRHQIRWYRAGSAAPERRLDLGPDVSPLSTSADGRLVLALRHRLEPVLLPPLVIDPEAWRERLCDVVDDRELTEEERDQLPAGTPDGPLCTPVLPGSHPPQG